jgi:hypothetical protein
LLGFAVEGLTLAVSCLIKQIALLEEQQNEAAEQVEDEANSIETEPAETEATTKDEGLDEKPDMNDVPMAENQVNCLPLFICLPCFQFL